jgi:hypothetical protein
VEQTVEHPAPDPGQAIEAAPAWELEPPSRPYLDPHLDRRAGARSGAHSSGLPIR